MALGHKLVVELSPDDRQTLKEMLSTDVGTMATILSAININKAQVTKADDREYIVAAVERAGGFEQLDKRVKAALRGWLASTAQAELRAAEASGEAALGLVQGLGMLYLDMGRHAEAEPLFRRALEGNEAALGPEHPSTLGSVNNLGSLYLGMGRHAEAEPLYRRALEGKEAALGPEHPETLLSVGNLGILYRDMGRHAEAEPLLRRAQQV